MHSGKILQTRSSDSTPIQRTAFSWSQRLLWSDGFWAVLFLVPTFLGLSLVLGSVLGGLVISFMKWDILTSPEWIGLENYGRMVLRDELFTKSLFNTFYYTAGVVPAGAVLSLALALILKQKLRGERFFRTVYFLPTVSSGIAVALLWAWLYNTQFGLINYLLSSVGISRIPWLGDTRFAMPAVIIMSVWQGLGYNMVLFLAGLYGISDEYYEAARIDGASRWQNFFHITLPLLSPTTFFVLILSMIGSFQVFEATYVMTQGGPFYATYTMVLYIFYQGFQYFRMGYASALAYTLFAIILILTLVQLRLEKRWVHYS